MALPQASDYLLINDGTKTYKVTYGELMKDTGVEGGDTPPSTPGLGDLWVDTSVCPPEIKIYSDCTDPGNPDWILIGAEEAEPAITFDLNITGNNLVGDTLTETVANLEGGIDPEIKTYQWKSDGVNVGTDSNTYVLELTDIDKVITCDVTCANSDDSRPKTKVATYDETPEAQPITFTTSITGGNIVGETLTAVAENIAGGVAPEVTAYQWYSGGHW